VLLLGRRGHRVLEGADPAVDVDVLLPRHLLEDQRLVPFGELQGELRAAAGAALPVLAEAPDVGSLLARLGVPVGHPGEAAGEAPVVPRAEELAVQARRAHLQGVATGGEIEYVEECRNLLRYGLAVREVDPTRPFRPVDEQPQQVPLVLGVDELAAARIGDGLELALELGANR
jgi:hypothetical protein